MLACLLRRKGTRSDDLQGQCSDNLRLPGDQASPLACGKIAVPDPRNSRWNRRCRSWFIMQRDCGIEDMVKERAIWTAAAYLVAKHGPAAPIVAERFALSNAEHDFEEQRAQWESVARATQALLRACPGEGESIH
jgi:hypothetical protein